MLYPLRSRCCLPRTLLDIRRRCCVLLLLPLPLPLPLRAAAINNLETLVLTNNKITDVKVSMRGLAG
jgi:hypothetical protein